MTAEPGEYILGRLEFYSPAGFGIALFDLLFGNLSRAVISDSGSLDDDVHVGRARCDRIKHVFGAQHIDGLDEWLFWESRPAGDERHLGSAARGHPCDGISHFAAGVVGDVAHRVDRFLRRPCGHEELFTEEVFLVTDRVLHARDQRVRLRHLAFAFIAAREQALRRLYNFKSVIAEYIQIILCCRILIHRCIHRRRYDLRAGARKHCGGKHVVRYPVRKLGDSICCRRSDQHYVCRFSK